MNKSYTWHKTYSFTCQKHRNGFSSKIPNSSRKSGYLDRSKFVQPHQIKTVTLELDSCGRPLHQWLYLTAGLFRSRRSRVFGYIEIDNEWDRLIFRRLFGRDSVCAFIFLGRISRKTRRLLLNASADSSALLWIKLNIDPTCTLFMSLASWTSVVMSSVRFSKHCGTVSRFKNSN